MRKAAYHLFLINAFGQPWDEIGASTPVKVTLDGDLVEDPTGYGINRAGYVNGRRCFAF